MAAPATDAELTRPAPADPGSWPRWARLVVALPELIVCAVAGFSIGPMILLLAGHFTPVPVFLLGGLGALIAVGVHGSGPARPEAHSVGFTLGALGLVGAWFGANVGYSAQNVYATRDPATYDITARWLMSHASLHIYTHPEVFGLTGGCPDTKPVTGNCFAGGNGFSPVDASQVYSQGNHLMPALAAVGGWLFGVDGVFKTNVALGAVALLALFALARQIVGPSLALLVTAAMGFSLPMIYVSRDTYSEPLMMLFLIGGLSLLYRAVGSRRPREFALAGFVCGCSALVRIDSYAALLSIVAAAVVVVGVAPAGQRRAALRAGGALLAAAAGPVFVGWLDLTRLSYGYYRDERHNVLLELKAGLLLLVVGVLVVAVLWRPRVRAFLDADATRGRLAVTAGTVVGAGFVLLASRPLWRVGHTAYNHTVAVWQAHDHVAVDGTRTYSEHTVTWLAQYFGWPTVVLAVAGYVILISALVRGRDYRLVGVLAMGLSMSALYLWASQIAPDQPWAIRRYVPVVLPILLVAAAAAIRTMWVRGPRWLRGPAALLAVVAVAFPLAVAIPMWGTREQNGQYAQVQAICQAMGPDAAVVEVDADSLAQYGQTMRSYCNVPSIGYNPATKAQLTAQLSTMNAAARAHGRRLYVLARSADPIPWASDAPSPSAFNTVTVPLWPHTFNGPPTGLGPYDRQVIQIFLGTVNADGTVEPVAPVS